MTTPATTLENHCGCDDQRAADGRRELARRSVLKGMAALGGAGMLSLAGPNAQYAFAAGTATDTLIVLSLRGGFDGLSMIAPVADPAYYTLRGSNAVPQSSALQLDQTFAMHPSMSPLKPLWDAGQLAAVVDVGQPAGTRSHFDAMAEMERASGGTSARTGWLDRFLRLAPPTGPFTATQVGSSAAPQSFIGPATEMTIGSLKDFRLSGVGNATELANWSTALRAMHSGGNPLVSGPVNQAMDALGTVTTLKAGYPADYAPPAAYPRSSDGTPTDLSIALDDTARLLKAGVGLRVVTIDCGHWDMHEWAGINNGWMFTQLREVSSALAAFAADLGPLFANTTIVTLSEFGRRVKINGTGGFDHGHGNQMIVLGGGVNGGLVHGNWGGLSDAALLQGDLPGRNDYRSVLGSILTNRMAVSSAELSTVFPNRPTTLLDVAKPRV